MGLASPAVGLGLTGFSCGGGRTARGSVTLACTDEHLLDDLRRASFQFFWEQSSPSTGQVKDRALANGNDTRTISSIAATGFGLTALCIADRRGYRPSGELANRARATLVFLLDRLPHKKGFFHHFIDMNTGARAFNSEVSSIDTAILMCGILTCRQHFGDAQIRSLATQLYGRVDWMWMLNSGATLSHGWRPETGFISFRWDAYSEHMMLYLLAIGSPTHPIPASSWNAWSRPMVQFQGLRYIAVAAPLFIHQYSHAWIDFRSKRDAHADYFENSVTATQAHKQFCLSLRGQFPHYSDDLWGITASDSVKGYVVWGGPPAIGPIDGTVIPAAAAGSLPFLFDDTVRVLRTIRSRYPRAWSRYGFVDAFNPQTNWYNPDVIGIDQGISLLMAENARSGFVWTTFMGNPEISAAMRAVGFH